jgi:predicted phage terminase large subunit-like protein
MRHLWPIEDRIEVAASRRRAATSGAGGAVSTPVLDLPTFIRDGWHVVEPTTPYVPGWHLDAISEHLSAVTHGEIRNLIINIPPRHMKSLSVCVFWPCWEWTTSPHIRWLFSSYSDRLATRDSLKCRRLIQSPWYQERWGHVFRLTGDQNEKTRFENDKTGYRLATGVGGAATGEGGDRLIVDDPIKAKDADSDAVRTSANIWWDETMSTRGNDPKTAAKVIIMQRLHEEDLTGHVLAKMREGGEEYEHLCLPAEYEPRTYVSGIGWSDPRTKEGELLWPARFGAEELALLKKSLGSYGASGQLQQNAVPRGGGMLKRGWWKYYRVRPSRFDEVVDSWDMTFKDTRGADFVAGHKWGRVGADAYLLGRIHDRMDFPAVIQAVQNLAAIPPHAPAKLVEAKANGPAVIAALIHKVPGLIAVEPDGSKVARAAAVSPYIEAGNVYLPDPSIAPWIEDVVSECASFPLGAHDDDVDAMSQALRRLLLGNAPWSADALKRLSSGSRV